MPANGETIITGINGYLANIINIGIITPWIVEKTHMRQEPGFNLPNLPVETSSSKTQRLIWTGYSTGAPRRG